MDDLFNRYPVNHAFQIVAYRTVDEYHWDKNHLFTGESHNFWEFVYVDKGDVTVITKESETILKSGEMVCHKPMEFHSIEPYQEDAAVIIFCFEADLYPHLIYIVYFSFASVKVKKIKYLQTMPKMSFDKPLFIKN